MARKVFVFFLVMIVTKILMCNELVINRGNI